MEQTLTAPSGLLRTKKGGAPVPLVAVSARAEIRDYASRLVVTQRFHNDEEQPIEAVYKFPLDEGAAICGFEVEIDGCLVKGHVEERDNAFEAYDQAISVGHGGYLLDEERADVFTASVGNLPPGKDAVLRLTTVSELSLDGDAIRFTLPTTIAPRYAPAEDHQGVGETEAERVSPPYALEVPYGLTLEVDVRTSAPVRGVESPTHPVKVSIDEGRATVSLSQREAALDRDVVIKITQGETHEPRALVERAPDGNVYALVSLRPRFDAAFAPAEVIFLLDRSGSMQGASIAEAKNALQLALRSLRPGCRFNIIGFGSTFKALFPESRAYDDASLALAAKHLKDLQADMGGTEILPALQGALRAETVQGLPRQLFVLTDGEVSNTDEVIALGRQHAGHARIFTFGIGAGTSHHLVKGLARAGEGEAELIAPGERIEGKVLRQLSRALTPALSDVSLDWGTAQAVQAPYEVPPVFADGRVLVFARFDGATPTTVTLKARSAEGSVTVSTRVDLAAAAEGILVGTLWARRMIRDLEEGRSPLHPRRGSSQPRVLSVKDEKVKAQIVALGQTWSLVSRHTSFVAVEKRGTPTQGEAQLRKVAVAITKGWHGIDAGRTTGLLASAPLSAVPGAVARLSSASVELSPQKAFKPRRASLGDRGSVPAILAHATGLSRSVAVPPSTSSMRPLDTLVALQMADGSWKLDDDLAKVLGWRSERELRKALGRPLASEREARAAATALALTWLADECNDSVDEWRILADKAREWLDRVPDGVGTWFEMATATLARR